jgi:multidrug efflux pump subunit AcrB
MGIIGFFSMPRDLFPPADRPQIAVVVQEPGATAKYIADLQHLLLKDSFIL